VLSVAKVVIGEGDMGLEHWQNDTGSGKTEVLEEKLVLVPSLPYIPHRLLSYCMQRGAAANCLGYGTTF
jgi:hypothetical protein